MTSVQEAMAAPLYKSIMSYDSVQASRPTSPPASVVSASSANTVRIGQSPMSRVLYNMLNALIGGGIVGLASIYKQCGIVGGCLLMLLFAILCTYTLSLLVQCAHLSRVADYEKLCEHCFGLPGYLCVCISLLLVDFGVMLSYLIILGDAAFKIANLVSFDSFLDR